MFVPVLLLVKPLVSGNSPISGCDSQFQRLCCTNCYFAILWSLLKLTLRASEPSRGNREGGQSYLQALKGLEGCTLDCFKKRSPAVLRTVTL